MPQQASRKATVVKTGFTRCVTCAAAYTFIPVGASGRVPWRRRNLHIWPPRHVLCRLSNPLAATTPNPRHAAVVNGVARRPRHGLTRRPGRCASRVGLRWRAAAEGGAFALVTSGAARRLHSTRNPSPVATLRPGDMSAAGRPRRLAGPCCGHLASPCRLLPSPILGRSFPHQAQVGPRVKRPAQGASNVELWAKNKYVGTLCDDDDNRLDLRTRAPPPSPRAASCQPSPFPLFFVFLAFSFMASRGGGGYPHLHIASRLLPVGRRGRGETAAEEIAAEDRRLAESGYFLLGVLSLWGTFSFSLGTFSIIIPPSIPNTLPPSNIPASPSPHRPTGTGHRHHHHLPTAFMWLFLEKHLQ